MDERVAERTHVYLLGGRETGALIQAHDWSSSLASPETWPQSLRKALNVQGPKLTALSDDAFRAVPGDQYPVSLGQPLSQLWPDHCPAIHAALDRVLSGEEALAQVSERRLLAAITFSAVLERRGMSAASSAFL